MPKRNRTNELRKAGGPRLTPPAGADVETDQARAARMFAESLRQQEATDRAERERHAAAAARTSRHDELQRAKQDAAAAIKRLRENGRPREKMAEAEATYRAATAALLEFETGERPHWAPAPELSSDAEPSDDAPADA